MESNESKTPYESWIKQEGVPIVEGYGLDLKEVALGPWPRKGGRGPLSSCGAWRAPREWR